MESNKEMFKGDLIIRTRRADEIEESEDTGAMSIMSKSPMDIRLKNVTVVLTIGDH